MRGVKKGSYLTSTASPVTGAAIRTYAHIPYICHLSENNFESADSTNCSQVYSVNVLLAVCWR